MRKIGFLFGVFAGLMLVMGVTGPTRAADIADAIEHPLVTRYPGQEIAWQTIENFRPFRIPLGPVTGYRQIGDWAETKGRVTRTFFRQAGTSRDFNEVYLNFLESFEAAAFDIRAQGISDDRRGQQIGSRQWLTVYLAENPFTAPGEVRSITAGTSSEGGAGSFVAWRDRAAGPVWVVVTVEQHAEDYIGTLIDIIEVDRAETGLVSVDPEAIGRDLTEKGRVVLDGLFFDFDSATLQPQSAAALEAIASYLGQHADEQYYVVGHTDAKGGFDYNRKLSQARAGSVVQALEDGYGIPSGQLEAHGVGPLVPVFSNVSDAGRDRNRRVELVEKP